MEDVKHLELLALNSKEIIEKQVDSYRQQHSYAGTITGATALFIPFFLRSFDGTSQVIQFISIVPTACFICAKLLMLSIFRTKPLDQAFNVTRYTALLSKTDKEILISEIEANAHSYIISKRITEKGNKRYSIGVTLTIVALLFSIVLILFNKFIRIEKAPAKIQVVIPTKIVVSKATTNSIGTSLFAVPAKH